MPLDLISTLELRIENCCNVHYLAKYDNNPTINNDAEVEFILTFE